MKNLFLLGLISLSSFTYAQNNSFVQNRAISSNAQKIYAALKVQPIRKETQELTEFIEFKKEVGNLKCIQLVSSTFDGSIEDKYECSISI